MLILLYLFFILIIIMFLFFHLKHFNTIKYIYLLM